MAGEIDVASQMLGALHESKEAILKRMDKQDTQLDKMGGQLSNLINTVDSDHAWIESTGRPWIEEQKRSVIWRSGVRHGVTVAMGMGGGASAVYLPKFLAFLGHIFAP